MRAVFDTLREHFDHDEIFKNKENLITYMPRKKIDHATKLLFILKFL